ncbi:C5orf35 [Perilla frutescens var. hirtella]|uniref:C5orf35 n=1 Tax=Perilla frutescens var. hirtella TaxID=608512 RepID=A0AAD4P2X4_PERFH|nr:C5orf35 [Perilla frutescens var. hirtella]
MTVYSGTAVAETKLMKRCEVSQKVKDLLGYTLEVEPSQIQDKDASQGLFLDGEADLGTVIAIYPGVTYSPAYYQYIPRYPRVDLHNPYLITRYDGTVINAQPWGTGGEAREMWDGSSVPRPGLNAEGGVNGSDRMWKLLSKPLDGSNVGGYICSPNIPFGGGQDVNMKKFGSFWFKSWKSSSTVADALIIKSLVLVATRGVSSEEILLNYRLSNLKCRPSWYTPVDEEEDRRRWS